MEKLKSDVNAEVHPEATQVKVNITVKVDKSESEHNDESGEKW